MQSLHCPTVRISEPSVAQANVCGSGSTRHARRPSLLPANLLSLMISVCLATTSVHAAVLETTAALTIRAQEILNGQPASVSQTDVDYPDDGTDLPLSASARVESTNLDGILVAVGQGFTEFADPDRLAQENPEELALEVACYSNDETVAYQVHGAATETRTIVFTNGAGSALAVPEIQFRSDGTREIESRLFLSGAILIWTPDLDTDDDGFPNHMLDGLQVDVQLTVDRLSDESDEMPNNLFDSGLSIIGEGSMLTGPDVTGSIVTETTDIDALVAEGLDGASADALRTVANAGSLTILLLPRQEHRYRYVARANETFLLRATLSVDIQNVAGGSGIALAIGRPFSQLTDFIEHALEGAAPTVVEQSLNAIVVKTNAGLIRAAGDNQRSVCGAFGAELIPLMLLAGLMPMRRRMGLHGTS